MRNKYCLNQKYKAFNIYIYIYIYIASMCFYHLFKIHGALKVCLLAYANCIQKDQTECSSLYIYISFIFLKANYYEI